MKKEIRGHRREFKKKEIALNTKNVGLRIFLAVTFLFVGCLFMMKGCASYVNKPTTLIIDNPLVINNKGEEIRAFNDEVQVYYYYDVNYEEKSKRQVSEEISEVLEKEVAPLFKLLDINNDYPYSSGKLHNLKYLNDNKNVFVNVDNSLYEILKYANDLMINSNSRYSIFGDSLIKAYNSLFNDYSVNGKGNEAIMLSDPLFNENMNNRFLKIYENINNNGLSLDFNDEKKEVRFNCPSELVNEVNLNLFSLTHAYYLDNIKEGLEAKSLTHGHVYSLTGMVATLGENLEDENGLYYFNSRSLDSLKLGQNVIDYTLYFSSSMNYMTFNPLINNSYDSFSENLYYHFVNNNKSIIRSLIIDFSNLNNEVVNGASFTFGSTSLVEQYRHNYLTFFEEQSVNENYIKEHFNGKKDQGIIITLKGNDNIMEGGSYALLVSDSVAKLNEDDKIPYLGVDKKRISSIIEAK